MLAAELKTAADVAKEDIRTLSDATAARLVLMEALRAKATSWGISRMTTLPIGLIPQPPSPIAKARTSSTSTSIAWLAKHNTVLVGRDDRPRRTGLTTAITCTQKRDQRRCAPTNYRQ